MLFDITIDGQTTYINQPHIRTSPKYLKEAKGLKEEEIAIGFMDETSPQLTANTVRIWSFEKPKIVKNTTRMKANTIGFYAIKGNSVQDFLENSKAESIANFLEKIKEVNEEYRGILVIMDNFRSHVSKEVRKRAEELGITTVYLPPYSHDLDPLEFIWKSLKRIISISFIKTLENLKTIIQQKYKEFSQRLSYATSWINRFLKKNGLCSELCR